MVCPVNSEIVRMDRMAWQGCFRKKRGLFMLFSWLNTQNMVCKQHLRISEFDTGMLLPEFISRAFSALWSRMKPFRSENKKIKICPNWQKLDSFHIYILQSIQNNHYYMVFENLLNTFACSNFLGKFVKFTNMVCDFTSFTGQNPNQNWSYPTCIQK